MGQRTISDIIRLYPMKKSNMKSPRHVRSLIVSSTNWCSTSPFRPLLRRRAVWLGWQRAAPARRYEAGFRWRLEQFWAACFRGICMDLQIWQCWRWKLWLEHVEDVGTLGTNSVLIHWSQVPSVPNFDPYWRYVFLPGIPVGRTEVSLMLRWQPWMLREFQDPLVR